MGLLGMDLARLPRRRLIDGLAGHGLMPGEEEVVEIGGGRFRILPYDELGLLFWLDGKDRVTSVQILVLWEDDETPILPAG